MEQSPHEQFCRINRPLFASQWFFHKQLSLGFAWVQGPTRWTVALFRAHTHSFTIRHLWRSYKRLLWHRHCIFPTFLCINRQEPFFERLSNCALSFENKSFLRPGFHAILNVCCWVKCPRMTLSHGMSHDDLITSRTASMLFGELAVFGGPSRTLSLSELRPRLNSLKQFLTVP